MDRPQLPPRPDEPGRDDRNVHAAVKFALVTAAIGVAYVVIAALSVNTCDGGKQTNTAVCGSVQRILLGSGAPVILFLGGVWAFLRTYRLWRERRSWWAWQGAGWFLLLLAVLTLTMGLPPIAGPVIDG